MDPQVQVLNEYISILEKTNQQLNLWTNPYGIAIGILTLLIGFLAIGVTYVLWKNSKDQRERTNEFFVKQEEIVKQTIKRTEEKFSELIQEYEEKLKGAKKRGKEIRKIIDDLKRERASVGSHIGPSGPIGLSASAYSALNTPISGYSGVLNTNKSMICNKCGKKFTYPSDKNIFDGDIFSVSTLGSDKTIYCSFCGAKNLKQ